MPNYPQYDLTSQYISQSYQRVLQTPGWGEVLDGLGNAVFISSSYSATASLLLGMVESSSYSVTASYALNSSGIDTSSFVLISQTSSMAVSYADSSGTSGYADSAGYATSAGSASYAITASYALNAGNQTPTIITSISGSNYVFDMQTGSYPSTFTKYTLASGSNARSGYVMSVWMETSLNITETTTLDIGDTSQVITNMEISSSNIKLDFFTPTDGWLLKILTDFM